MQDTTSESGPEGLIYIIHKIHIWGRSKPVCIFRKSIQECIEFFFGGQFGWSNHEPCFYRYLFKDNTYDTLPMHLKTQMEPDDYVEAIIMYDRIIKLSRDHPYDPIEVTWTDSEERGLITPVILGEMMNQLSQDE